MLHKYTALILRECALSLSLVVAAAPQTRPTPAGTSATTDTTRSVTADGAPSPAQAGERRPLYRIRKSDVLEIGFTFAPEFNQSVTVQPDGFIALKGETELYAQDLTISQFREAVRKAYSPVMHDPEVSVVLKDFDRPFFLAGGQVNRPGKYELRADITVTEAVAIAGGFNELARHSQVVLFRRISDDQVESHLLNVKQMLSSRNLAEDIHLQPGDMIFVPQNTISKIRRYLPSSDLSLYASPTQF